MAKRFCISPVIGSGISGNAYRAKVATLLSGVYSCHSLIPSNADGTPRFNWALCVITSDAGFAAVDADAGIETFPGVSLDDTIGSFSVAVRNKVQTALTNRGVNLTGITLSSTIADLIQRVADQKMEGNIGVLRRLWGLLT
jgi:hypothetical protein